MTSLSVVIPTYNRPEMLAQALESLTNQNVSELQAVVVNDGGDRVDAITSGFAGTINIKLINLDENCGVSAARNAGIDASDGDYIAFLDDDDIVLPRHYNTTLDRLQRGDCDAVSTFTSVYTARPEKISAASLSSQVPVASYGFENAEALLPVVAPFTPNSFVCRSPRRTSARFDESLETTEDWDMWLRLVQGLGYRLKVLPQATAVYFRVLGVHSAINSVTTNLQSLRSHHHYYGQVYDRWPVETGSRQEYLREMVWQMFASAEDCLAGNVPIDPFYYEKILPHFSAYLLGTISGSAVAQAIADVFEMRQ